MPSYSELMAKKVKVEPLTPRLVDTKQAGLLVGKTILIEKMEKAKWLSPVVNRHSCKLFAVADVDTCIARLKNGEYPE